MLSDKRRPAVLAVLLSAVLLSSSAAGLAVAGSPSTVDAQDTEPIDGDDVIGSFVERIETLETVEFTRESETTVNNNTFTTTEVVAVDLTDSQRRVDIVNASIGSNSTTVRDGSDITTYNRDTNTVTDVEVSGVSLLPQIQTLANESWLDYEYLGTETVNGQDVYVLELIPQKLDAEEFSQSSATLYVDTETYFPVHYESETRTDEYNTSRTVAYENVTLNEEIPDSTFEIDLPDDVQQPSPDTGVDIERHDSYDELATETSLTIPDAELPGQFSFDGAMTIQSGDDTGAFLSYTDGETSLGVHISADSVSTIDYEDSDNYEPVDIGDTTGYLYSTDTYSSLRFEDGQSYTVSGEINNSTAITVAESITGE